MRDAAKQPDDRDPGTVSRLSMRSSGRGSLRVNRLLSLAAAPVFAIMSGLSALNGAYMPALLCSAMPGGAQVTGMPVMYALMGAFHLGPWLRIWSARCRRSDPK